MWILSNVLPGGTRGERILAELDRDAERETLRRSPRAVGVWYWRQVLSLVWHYATHRSHESARQRNELPRPAWRRVTTWCASLAQDARFAVRSLRRSPGFLVAVVGTLALGIGANTAIFSVVNGVLLRPLPFEDAERLVTVCETNPSIPAGHCVASPPNVSDWRDQSTTLDEIGFGRGWAFILDSGEGGRRVAGGLASTGLFQALRLGAEHGRLFDDTDFASGRTDIAVLSHELWQTEFGGDAAIVGRRIQIDDRPHTILGILPRGIEVPRLEQVQLWTPIPLEYRTEGNRDWRGFLVIGRLAPETNVDESRREMTRIATQLRVQYPVANAGWGIAMRPLRDDVVASVRPTLLVFLGAVFLVLLVACANVANLLLARSAARRREFALRTALGAGRGRLVRLLAVESVLLVSGAGVLGAILAAWGVRVFLQLAPAGIPRLDQVGIDGRALQFATFLSALTAVGFGLLPARRAGKLDLARALKEGGDHSCRAIRGGPQAFFVIAEVAFAMVLLVGAGLLAQSFVALTRWDPGFDRRHLVTTWLSVSSGRFPDGAAVVRAFDEIVAEVSAVPGVTSAGTASAGPLFGGAETEAFEIAGREQARGEQPVARWYDVGPTFFTTLGVPLLRGRSLAASDTRQSTPVAVVNQTMAQRFWPQADALGSRVTMYGRAMTVVGIVADVAPLTPGVAPGPEIFWAQQQAPRYASYLLVRTDGSRLGIADAIRDRIAVLNPDVHVSAFTLIDELLARRLVSPKFNAVLLVTFAGVAVLLATVGIYALLSYVVARRNKEIAVRLALGASGRNVITDVWRRAMVLTAIGAAIGCLGAVAFGRLLEGMLPGVAAADVGMLVAVTAGMVVVATVACVTPARRALRLHPVIALRGE